MADAAAVKAAAKGKSKSGGASKSEEWAVFVLQGASAGFVVRDVVIHDVAPDDAFGLDMVPPIGCIKARMNKLINQNIDLEYIINI